ncbi:hypothetical protein HK101_001109 [Irineochytrium annulatum]|nr:hypothetical protein HK101_001109 [Irineochytrium annulatum]
MSILTELLDAVPPAEQQELRSILGPSLVDDIEDLRVEADALRAIRDEYRAETAEVREFVTTIPPASLDKTSTPQLADGVTRPSFQEDALMQRIRFLVDAIQSEGLSFNKRAVDSTAPARNAKLLKSMGLHKRPLNMRKVAEVIDELREALNAERATLKNEIDLINGSIEEEYGLRGK